MMALQLTNCRAKYVRMLADFEGQGVQVEMYFITSYQRIATACIK